MKDNGQYYSDYLGLEKVLSAQKLASAEAGKPVHDEMLFIIIHEVYELWFKQIIFEIDSIREIFSGERLEDESMGIICSRLNRITTIQRVLLEQINVLETMTPMDFLEFRDFITPASGFQSFQFRLVENKLGLRVRQEYGGTPYANRLSAEHRKLVERSESEPSLLEYVDQWLYRTPFLRSEEFNFWPQYQAAVRSMLETEKERIESNSGVNESEKKRQTKRIEGMFHHFEALFDEKEYNAQKEKGERYLKFQSVQAALLIFLYREQPALNLPYQLLSSLIDIDEGFAAWRDRHALMVHRMIGVKTGTGGSAGYEYLRATAEKHKVFTEISNLSTFLIPMSERPALPQSIKKALGFGYQS